MLNKPHKRLTVWKKSLLLISTVYKLTKSLPSSEKFALCSQMRRAALSITANIAEGAARKSFKDKIRFINIASSSLSELDTHFEVCLVLNYFNEEDLAELNLLLTEVDKMLSGLSKSYKIKHILPKP